MVTISLLAQPLLACSQFSLTPFIIPVHRFAKKYSPNTHGQTSVHQYLEQTNHIFPVPHYLNFHRLKRCTLFGSFALGKAAESTVDKPSARVSIHTFPHFSRGRQGNPPPLWAHWLFCTEAVILHRQ